VRRCALLLSSPSTQPRTAGSHRPLLRRVNLQRSQPDHIRFDHLQIVSADRIRQLDRQPTNESDRVRGRDVRDPEGSGPPTCMPESGWRRSRMGVHIRRSSCGLNVWDTDQRGHIGCPHTEASTGAIQQLTGVDQHHQCLVRSFCRSRDFANYTHARCGTHVD
jgi:hypothetical protein